MIVLKERQKEDKVPALYLQVKNHLISKPQTKSRQKVKKEHFS